MAINMCQRTRNMMAKMDKKCIKFYLISFINLLIRNARVYDCKYRMRRFWLGDVSSASICILSTANCTFTLVALLI